MYAEFSYDLIAGQHANDDVLTQILEKFATKPNGEERRRCDLLSDTFICEIANSLDFESVHQRIATLRLTLGEQFNYAFSLRSRGDVMRIRGSHNETLARQIIDS
jgi:hypothetical protein